MEFVNTSPLSINFGYNIPSSKYRAILVFSCILEYLVGKIEFTHTLESVLWHVKYVSYYGWHVITIQTIYSTDIFFHFSEYISMRQGRKKKIYALSWIQKFVSLGPRNVSEYLIIWKENRYDKTLIKSYIDVKNIHRIPTLK